MTIKFKLKKMAHTFPSALPKVWVGVILILSILLVSCGSNKHDIAAGLPAPDAAFMTGVAAGYNVFIWECHQGRRIVIYKESGEMWSSSYRREESVCGSQTPIEITLADAKAKRDIDPKEFWK